MSSAGRRIRRRRRRRVEADEGKRIRPEPEAPNACPEDDDEDGEEVFLGTSARVLLMMRGTSADQKGSSGILFLLVEKAGPGSPDISSYE